MSEEEKIVNKEGRWSKAEEKYMRDNYKTLSINEIAKNIKRNPETVRKYIKEKIMRVEVTEFEAIANKTEFDLKRSPIWTEIVQQFTQDEQEIFIYNWANVMAQFDNDVLPTERMQIIDVCRNEILLNRSLRRMKDVSVSIESFQEQLRDEEAKQGLDRDVDKIIDLKRMIAECMGSASNFTREYKDLLDKKNSTLKDIKGTREQRIKRIEDSRENITSWMSAIISNPEHRKNLALEAERFRLAMDVERKRLSEYYQFGDEIEQPILNSDTIKPDNV